MLARHTPLRSRSRLARRAPVGAAARRRVKAGGVIAKGRQSLPLEAYRALKAYLYERSGGKCERCHSRELLTPEHSISRSAGGSDDKNNVWCACVICHRLKEAPYAKGRLLVYPLGNETFDFMLVKGSKHDYDVLERILYRVTSYGGEWIRTV